MSRQYSSALLAAMLLSIAPFCSIPVLAQETTAAEPAAGSFSTEQLEQLVAPIALYPDSLLMQILMASTYPLEIVSAQRWVEKNPGLKDSALDEALKEQDWDASVKSLCTFPDLLTRMGDNLDWTQDLGDAFLEQKDELLDTVQHMRGKAYDAGNLQTTEQQVVTVEKEKIIVIQSPSPEVVYVPTYSPTVVYGPYWGYPTYYYPPLYVPPPPGYGLVTFSIGVAVGAAIWGNCHWGWGHHNVNINVNRYNNFNRNTNINANINNINRGSGQVGWQHNPSHRGGVNYKNPKVASQYGASTGSTRVSTKQARGWSQTGAANRSANSVSTRRPDAGNISRPDTPSRSRDTRMRDQPGTANRQPAAAASNRADRTAYGGSGVRSGNSAYSGASSPRMDRAASNRGSASRGTASFGGGRPGGRHR